MKGKPKCSKMLPGYFMSDPYRHCYRSPKYIVAGKYLCGIHAKQYIKQAEQRGEKLPPEIMIERLP